MPRNRSGVVRVVQAEEVQEQELVLVGGNRELVVPMVNLNEGMDPVEEGIVLEEIDSPFV